MDKQQLQNDHFCIQYLKLHLQYQNCHTVQGSCLMYINLYHFSFFKNLITITFPIVKFSDNWRFLLLLGLQTWFFLKWVSFRFFDKHYSQKLHLTFFKQSLHLFLCFFNKYCLPKFFHNRYKTGKPLFKKSKTRPRFFWGNFLETSNRSLLRNL